MLDTREIKFLFFLYFPLFDLNIKLSLPADCNTKRGFTSGNEFNLIENFLSSLNY